MKAWSDDISEALRCATGWGICWGPQYGVSKTPEAFLQSQPGGGGGQGPPKSRVAINNEGVSSQNRCVISHIGL